MKRPTWFARPAGLYIAALALCLLFPTAILAQTAETGVLEGRVVDETGAPVSSASVQVARADGSYAKGAVTSETGTFRIGFLPPGNYDVTVSMIGYRQTTLSEFRVSAAQVATLALEIERAPIEMEALRVEAGRPMVDRSTTEVTTTLDTEQIDRLPNTRTATDLINFTPGARPDQVFGGSTEQANSYQLDGVTVNAPGFGGDFLLPNVDWIEEVQVKGLGAGAEYGNFQGGLFNIVTKSGTNTWTGSARFFFEGVGLNQSSENTLQTGDELYNQWELNASLGGPIVRDKLFFFLSAQELRTNNRALDLDATTDPGDPVYVTDPSGGRLLEERREFKLLGKLNWQASQKDVVTAMLGKDDVYTENSGLNAFDAVEALTKDESPAWFWNVGYGRTFNENNLLELKVTGWTGRDDELPRFGPNTPSIQLLGGNRNVFQNAVFTRQREPTSLAAAANWDSYWTTGSVRHRVKFGGNYEYGSWLENRTRNANLTWRPECFDPPGCPDFDETDTSTWAFISSDWEGRIRLDANTVNAALFVQDYMDITDRLSLNAGLRLGIWNGKLNPEGAESFTAVEDVKLAPRIGLNYDLVGDNLLVAKGHWGRYYQNLFALMFDRAEKDGVPGALLESDEYWDWIDASDPELDRPYTREERDQFFEFFDDSGTFDTGPVVDYKQPYVDQFVVGLASEFRPGWKAEAVYVNRRNRDVLAMVDRNLSTNYTKYENVSVVDFRSGDPVQDHNGNDLVLGQLYISNDDILFLGEAPGLTPGDVAALTFDQDIALTTTEDGERKFDQIQVSLARQARAWAAQASVVYTDLRGNFFTVNGYEAANGTGLGAFVRPNEQTNFNGKLPGFADWEFKLRLDGNIVADLQGGLFLTVQSGDRYTPVYDIDPRNHDFYTEDGQLFDPDHLFGISGERVFLEQRGDLKYETQALMDLHLDYTLRLTGVGIQFGLDVFNLFGVDALTSADDLVNFGTFGTPFFRVPGRSIRLVTSLRFPNF